MLITILERKIVDQLLSGAKIGGWPLQDYGYIVSKVY